MNHKFLFLLPCLLCGADALRADTAPALTGASDSVETAVQRAHEENIRLYKNDPDALVLPGLLASRKGRQVTIWCKATGLAPTEPVEFLLIPPDGGKDYEALAISSARAGDIHRALVFIGMPPGRPVNAKLLQFWPKGERVVATFEWESAVADGNEPQATGSVKRAVRAEELVIGLNGKPLKSEGLVFVEATSLAGGKGASGAEGYEPFSIASVYNEPDTILDVPWRAPQSEFYERQKANPQHRLQKGQTLLVRMKPERADGSRRVADLRLRVRLGPEKGSGEPRDVVSDLAGRDGENFGAGMGASQLLAAIQGLVAKGRDPFVAIEFDDALAIRDLCEFCKFLLAADTEAAMRIEPPAPGHLYYRAFLPDETLRERSKRIAQPRELHLRPGDSGTSATVVRVEQIWKDGKTDPDLKPVELSAGSRDSLEALLRKELEDMPVLFVFAPPQTRYGELMQYVGPALSAQPIVYVYVQDQ